MNHWNCEDYFALSNENLPRAGCILGLNGLLSDTKSGKNAGQHVFGRGLTRDLAKVSERVVKAYQSYFFASLSFQRRQ